MAAIGTNTVTSIARRFILPEIADVIYDSNPVFFRMNRANKKIVQGGTQIEVPLMKSQFTAGGSYNGYDLLDVSPSDTIQNAVYDWAQYHVPVAVDGRTLIKTDSPEAIANFLSIQFDQAKMQMAENLGVGLWSDGTADTDGIVGLGAAVDDGGNVATYAGITRSGNAWWQASDDSSTSTLTALSLNAAFQNASKGGKHPTLIACRIEQYNRIWNVAQGDQRFPAQVGGSDEQLASVGFTNVLFNNTPVVVDSHVFDGPNTSNSAIVFLHEDALHLAVSPRADFYMQDFQTPVNQDAMVSQLFWAGQLVTTNCALQSKMSAVTG